MRRIARLIELTALERRLLLESLCTLPLVSCGLRTLGMRRFQTLLARWRFPTRPGHGEADESSPVLAQTAARMVAIAARRLRVRCLDESVALWWLLRRRGIESTLRVGVNTQRGALRAHAWVECDDHVLNDDGDVARRYSPFERDFAGTAKRTR